MAINFNVKDGRFLHICTKVDEIGTIHTLCGAKFRLEEDSHNAADYSEHWLEKFADPAHVIWKYYEPCQACMAQDEYPLLVLGAM